MWLPRAPRGQCLCCGARGFPAARCCQNAALPEAGVNTRRRQPLAGLLDRLPPREPGAPLRPLSTTGCRARPRPGAGGRGVQRRCPSRSSPLTRVIDITRGRHGRRALPPRGAIERSTRPLESEVLLPFLGTCHLRGCIARDSAWRRMPEAEDTGRPRRSPGLSVLPEDSLDTRLPAVAGMKGQHLAPWHQRRSLQMTHA